MNPFIEHSFLRGPPRMDATVHYTHNIYILVEVHRKNGDRKCMVFTPTTGDEIVRFIKQSYCIFLKAISMDSKIVSKQAVFVPSMNGFTFTATECDLIDEDEDDDDDKSCDDHEE